MYRLSRQYAQDMAPLATLSATEVFEVLRRIPYVPDPKGVEFLKRPYYTLRSMGPGGDCDDKAIAVGAWAHLRKIPFRFLAVSRHPFKPLHHVFAEVKMLGGWQSMDPTYLHNTYGQRPRYAKTMVLTG